MTPAERIDAAFDLFDTVADHDTPERFARNLAHAALDALCPKGKRVVLDRTGDTDQLIKQSQTYAGGWTLGTLLWVDIEDGDDE